MVIKAHDHLGLVAHFPASGRFRVGEEFPWLDPETNEVAIGWRLIGMAARIHEHEPPEAIAGEAQTALDELGCCKPGAVRDFAMEAAERLIAFATAVHPAAREIAEHSLADSIEVLRDAIRTLTGREAA